MSGGTYAGSYCRTSSRHHVQSRPIRTRSWWFTWILPHPAHCGRSFHGCLTPESHHISVAIGCLTSLHSFANPLPGIASGILPAAREGCKGLRRSWRSADASRTGATRTFQDVQSPRGYTREDLIWREEAFSTQGFNHGD